MKTRKILIVIFLMMLVQASIAAPRRSVGQKEVLAPRAILIDDFYNDQPVSAKYLVGYDINGVIYAPLRDLAESLGSSVKLDPFGVHCSKVAKGIVPNGAVWNENDVLTGIVGLGVSVSPFPDNVKIDSNLVNHNFTSDALQVHIETKLRQSGIALTDSILSTKTNAQRNYGGLNNDEMAVTISILRDDQMNAYDYTVRVDVVEPIMSMRTKKVNLFGTIWTTGQIGRSTMADGPNQIIAALDIALDQFLNAYAKANPK